MRLHSQSQDVEVAVKKVINDYLEKFLLVVLIVSGIVLIYFAKDLSDFIPSLLLNIGSNIVVFVSVYWIFQYFIGRQPGSRDGENYENYRNIFDSEATHQNYQGIGKLKRSRRVYLNTQQTGNWKIPDSLQDHE
jgi:MFS superfamily sulfate permease-like transporter